MPSYKFTITSIIGAQTEDEAKKIFVDDLIQMPPEELVYKAEIEEISE